MSKHDQKVENLLTVARRSDDAESLWQIARELEQLSAWDKAREVERKAEQAERRMAEEATR
jgi:hypothetical protein